MGGGGGCCDWVIFMSHSCWLQFSFGNFFLCSWNEKAEISCKCLLPPHSSTVSCPPRTHSPGDRYSQIYTSSENETGLTPGGVRWRVFFQWGTWMHLISKLSKNSRAIWPCSLKSLAASCRTSCTHWTDTVKLKSSSPNCSVGLWNSDWTPSSPPLPLSLRLFIPSLMHALCSADTNFGWFSANNTLHTLVFKSAMC